MNEARIAAPLLTLLASGGTLERTVVDLPAFKTQIEASFDWMKLNARCTAGELEQLASRLRELTRSKLDALKNKNFDLAADIRAKECELFESLGLKGPTGTTGTILYDGIEKQVQDLSALLAKIKRTGKGVGS